MRCPVWAWVAIAVSVLAPAGYRGAKAPANVDMQRLVNADKAPGNWMSHRRT